MRYRLDEKGNKRITAIAGDGIGPEVVGAARRIVDAAAARRGGAFAWEEREAGAAVFKRGLPSGVPQETLDSIEQTRVVLKGPLETPVGFGEKSANVTLRKLFETYGNLRPIRELPNVPTPFSGRGIDLIVVRENVEDLYAGIEHHQTPTVAQCLKLMSRLGCEKIVRLAFEVAASQGRRSVHCATKANIMKLTEGLLKRTFEEVATEYPQIQAHHIIVDNCAHQLVRFPEQFEVIVTSNMNGDILSDLTSGLVGGLGFAPGANIGNDVAIFEAVHGSAPALAGKDSANPTAVILSAVMMLRHLDEHELAGDVENAVLATLESGVYTRDVRREGASGTSAFAQRVIDHLGQRSQHASVREHRPIQLPQLSTTAPVVDSGRWCTAGVDVFIQFADGPQRLGARLEELAKSSALKLKMISNRGTKVYPPTGAMTDCVDHYRCRFLFPGAGGRPSETEADAAILSLTTTIAKELRWMHLEKLMELDGKLAYTKAQGED
jgi:isocitrate dehydrogenase